MFTIKMYQFNGKKINSTKVPTISGDSFACEMKTSSSILFPVVEIRTGSKNAIVPLYNYAYIQEFNRYYWIDDIVYDLNCWIISMHCDALASFRNEILATYQYVARSSTEYDESILDTMYLSKVSPFSTEVDWGRYAGIGGDTDKVYVSSGGGSPTAVKLFNVGFTSGYFVVGIVGGNTAGITFYSFTNANFKDFITNALTFTPSDMSDVSSGVANAVFNPIQYITSVRWFPIAAPYSSTTSSIKVGGYTIPGSYTAGIISTGATSEAYLEIAIPRNYWGDKYTNLSPYAEYSLVFQPFGVIPLDSTKMFNVDKIAIRLHIDFCYGLVTLYVSRRIPNGTPPQTVDSGIIYSVTTEYGVTLPISSLVMDWKAGAVVSALQFLKSYSQGDLNPFKKEITANTEKSAGRGKPNDLLSPHSSGTLPEHNNNSGIDVSLIDKAMDLTASALGQISTCGAVGSFMAYRDNAPYIEGWFKKVVDTDVNTFGKPLYKLKLLSSLSGLTVCINSKFWSATAMEEEIATIQSMLNTGVYIE